MGYLKGIVSLVVLHVYFLVSITCQSSSSIVIYSVLGRNCSFATANDIPYSLKLISHEVVILRRRNALLYFHRGYVLKQDSGIRPLTWPFLKKALWFDDW
jgi:hypothetical protein